jgi:cellobiose-specific phosphotransferase system component IIC
MATWQFTEVFILIGLHGACSVSVVDTGVTDTVLAQNVEIRKNGIDSIGLTN